MLMTGRLPSHSGIVLNRVEASPVQNPDCLAQLFARAGYDTGFIGKWHLSAGPAKYQARFEGDREGRLAFFEQNPDLEFTPPGPDRLGFRHWEAYNYHTDFLDYWFYRDEPVKIRPGGYETDVQVEQAIAYIDERRKRGEPFLLCIAPHPPHPPFEPQSCPSGWLERVPQQLAWAPNVPPDAPLRQDPLSARCYYAMIQHLDACVGRLLDYLDESGLSASTLAVFTSDHGEMLGSRNDWGKMTPYRESVGIPLVMRWPGVIPAGRRTATLHTPVDHLTTLCAVAGIRAPDYVDGLDLGEVLRGGSLERDAVLMMNYVGGWVNFKTGEPKPEWRGVHTPRHTYVKWLGGGEELYDDRADPWQMRNLIDDPAAREDADVLRARLERMLAEAHDAFLPGAAYAEWYDSERNLLRTGLGPVPAT
jgi:arylsulfatase A-like enzyme